MKTIELTRGKVTIVDNEDYGKLSQNKWYANGKKDKFYAVRHIWVDGKTLTEQMHRRILGLKRRDGKHTDHINGDALDNRRRNIRICKHKENCRNRKIQSNNRSGFKGVGRNGRKWRARIGINHRLIYLGSFYSPFVAALAYNQAATKYFGEFAQLNEVEV